MKLDEQQSVAKTIIEKIVSFVLLEATTTIVLINNHMAVI
jgi:hypothetical protein